MNFNQIDNALRSWIQALLGIAIIILLIYVTFYLVIGLFILGAFFYIRMKMKQGNNNNRDKHGRIPPRKRYQ